MIDAVHDGHGYTVKRVADELYYEYNDPRAEIFRKANATTDGPAIDASGMGTADDREDGLFF
jgi:hypothetical protein